MPRATPYDRDAALDAAMTLFWNKGYHATSLKDLEAALAMKPGSIYAAFTNKETLYLLALERYFERSRARFREIIAQAQTPLQGLANHLRSYIELPMDNIARQSCMLTKTLVDTRATDPELAEATRAYMDAMRAEFIAAFTQARAAGDIPDTSDPERLARRYQSNLSALRFALLQDLTPTEFEHLANDMALEIEHLNRKEAK